MNKIGVVALIVGIVVLATLVESVEARPVNKVRVVVLFDNPKALSAKGFTVQQVRVNAENAVKRFGGKVIYRFKLINAVVVEVPEKALPYLERLPGVYKVEYDAQAKAFADTIPWGVQRVGAPAAWKYTTGSSNGVIEVAVLDTGVDYNHPDLRNNIAWCVSTIGGRVSNYCYDGNGHGTHVIGTVAAVYNGYGVVGVAPQVEIYAIKVLDDSGRGSYTDIAMGIELALLGPDGVLDRDGDGKVVGDPDDDAAEVISMSLGGPTSTTYLREVVQAAYRYGAVIVAASGNEGSYYPSYPAAYPEVIAVGATDSNDNVPWWSNKRVEVAAPGVNVLSTYPGGGYRTMSGTSMATPHVSGVVALIQALVYNRYGYVLPPGTIYDWGTSTVRGILHMSADDLGYPGWDIYYGYGIVRADRAVQLLLS
ncbi:subtilisin-like serine protease precursor [Pyrococcus sp. NA2]|uniref:S8 family peptidase n=1 Tax=Pyrococcus sp. (strain NA2) TaxID=342949 RepID=UPI000209AC70|nr:S8 family peptidase [Pyrococcus sp. NA2]AEC52752.1 subtilisin-like serine protease precursor [Pyrococcus sp. NA2]